MKTAGDLVGADYVLSDLRQCTIHLRGRMGALRIQNVQDCLVYAGPVAGATFVNGKLTAACSSNMICQLSAEVPVQATLLVLLRHHDILLAGEADVQNSCLILISHQLRIHSSSDVTFLLRVQSNPIIEDCRGMR